MAKCPGCVPLWFSYLAQGRSDCLDRGQLESEFDRIYKAIALRLLAGKPVRQRLGIERLP
jgi:hypothetical protein